VALVGAERGSRSQWQFPAGGLAALARSRHPLQSDPALGSAEAAVVALPAPAVAPLADLAHAADRQRRAAAVCGGAGRRPVPAGRAPGGTNTRSAG